MSLLFYTAANKKYEHFVPLYIYFTLKNNPRSYVEVGLENPENYKNKNRKQIDVLRGLFGDKFKLTTVSFQNTLPGAVRFINEPSLSHKCDYVYIGDVDIVILDGDIKDKHLENMKQNNTSFSNIIRDSDSTERTNYRLSGLHFAPTDVQYPLPDLSDIDYSRKNNIRGADEHVLYQIMKKKNEMVPRELDYRPIHGIHMRAGCHPFGGGMWKSPKLSFDYIANGSQTPPWTGLENQDYRQKYLNQIKDPDFKELFFCLDVQMKNMLMVLENACVGRFDEFETEMRDHVITEPYYKKLMREAIRTAKNKGLLSVGKKTIKYVLSRKSYK